MASNQGDNPHGCSQVSFPNEPIPVSHVEETNQLAFAAINSVFEAYSIAIQLKDFAAEDFLIAEPDLSASTAVSVLAEFVPGCLSGLVLLLCFGTTHQFRREIYKTFVPLRFRRTSSANSICSSTASYAAMDDDPGVLSRQRRLSVERRMKIQVTTEVEIKMEVLDKPVPLKYGARSGYHVDQHHWDDAAPILSPHGGGYC